MLKRLLFFAVSAALILSLAACGGGGTVGVDDDRDDGRDDGRTVHSQGESPSQEPSHGDEGGGDSGGIMWLDPGPSWDVVTSAAWEFYGGEIGANETILSVSPSGTHILTVDHGEMNIAARLLTGKNELGWTLNYISLYEYQGGTFSLAVRMDFDAGSDPELNDTLATCGREGVAWNGDETRVLLTADQKNLREYFRMADANIFLIDFDARSIENLTGEEGRLIDDYKDLVPKWYAADTAYFVRYETAESFDVHLMKLNPETGEVTLAADLSFDGAPSMVHGYEIIGDTVYYCLAGGFYTTGLDGASSAPTCLVDLFDDRKVELHPYARDFASMRVSPDGRRVCLMVSDQRLFARDIPLADDPAYPQPDPRSAVSVITGREWVPCHDVMLYDLVDNCLVDPFVNAALRPDVAIVLTADFAPDGGSLLCAVFGDGGVWTMASLERTTLYQVRLDDGSFDAVRVFDIETGILIDHVSWLERAVIHMSADAPRVFNHMMLVLPAAFTRFIP